MTPYVFETRIRFIDTDASGRIHYTCMFRYFESAEIEFLRTVGISYRETEISFPRVHVECDYRLQLRFDDVIQIEVCLTKLGRSSVRFEFRALRSGEVAATGAIVVVCMDGGTQRSTPIPDGIRAQLASIMRTKQSEG